MPELEFLANMNISPLTVVNLREIGWKIVRIPEVMDKKSKDMKILEYARNNSKAIITQDLDFSALLAVGGYEKPSVINLRIENPTPEVVTQRIIQVVSKIEKELAEGIVASVDETSIRYRNLPIRFG